MRYIAIRNWGKYQHYKDRNPPWIKLHGELMTSIDWVASNDASRILMVALMTLAAKLDNKIPYDPAYIKRVCYLNSKPDFTQLLELQFIEIIDNSQLASTKTDAASNPDETLDQRQSTEEEAEIEGETERHSAASQPVLVEADSAEKAVKRVWDYYHRKFKRSERYEFTPKRKGKGMARYLDCLKLARGDPEQAAFLMKQVVDAVAASDHHVTGGYFDWEKNLFPSTEKLQWWLDRKQGQPNGGQTKAQQRQSNSAKAISSVFRGATDAGSGELSDGDNPADGRTLEGTLEIVPTG